MIKIKLVRTGKRNSPKYRIAVQNAKQKVKGKVLEYLGFFIPNENNTGEFKLTKERYDFWIKNGALPTDSVVALIKNKYKYVKYSPKKDVNTKENTEANVDNIP